MDAPDAVAIVAALRRYADSLEESRRRMIPEALSAAIAAKAKSLWLSCAAVRERVRVDGMIATCTCFPNDCAAGSYAYVVGATVDRRLGTAVRVAALVGPCWWFQLDVDRGGVAEADRRGYEGDVTLCRRAAKRAARREVERALLCRWRLGADGSLSLEPCADGTIDFVKYDTRDVHPGGATKAELELLSLAIEGRALDLGLCRGAVSARMRVTTDADADGGGRLIATCVCYPEHEREDAYVIGAAMQKGGRDRVVESAFVNAGECAAHSLDAVMGRVARAGAVVRYRDARLRVAKETLRSFLKDALNARRQL